MHGRHEAVFVVVRFALETYQRRGAILERLGRADRLGAAWRGGRTVAGQAPDRFAARAFAREASSRRRWSLLRFNNAGWEERPNREGRPMVATPR